MTAQQLAHGLPGAAAAVGVVILAVLGLLRLSRFRLLHRRDGSVMAHEAIARRCNDADLALAEYGHELSWEFPETGGLYGTCGGCRGTVEITPGDGFIDTEYSARLAAGTGAFLACAGQLEGAR